MMTAASQSRTRQTATMDEDRASRPAARASSSVNPVWTGLALGGVVQRKCAACASGGTCPACEEEEQSKSM